MADLNYDIVFNSNTVGLDNAEKALGEATQTTKTFAQAVSDIGTGQQGLDNIRDLINAIEQAGGSVSNLRQRYDQLVNSFDNLNTREQGQQVRRLREYFESLGSSMTEVVSNSHKLDDELSDTGSHLKKLGDNAERAKEKLNKTQKTTEQLGSVANTAKAGIDKLSGALAALGIGFGLKELADVADAYTTLSARIAVAVGETGNVQQAMAGVQQVALATNSSLDATSQLFAKIHDVGKSMGLTQEQSLKLTQTINQAISLSGGSAAAAEASITQLSQALASGVLRGDEFNSINEQAPEIMKALANSLSVTTGELRKMAEEGKLSSQVVVNALQSQAGAIEDKFSKFPTTIGQALQNIKTQWQIVAGEFNAESGASAVVVKALNTIGENLSWLKNVFDDVGSGVTWFSDKLSQIDDSTINELKNTLALAYETVKDLAKSIGDMGQTAWSAFKSMLDGATPLFNAFVHGKEEVDGLDSAIQALQVGLGVLSDGATGASIAFNLLVGSLQFLAGGFQTLKANVADFLGFDDVANQAKQASDKLFAAAEQSIGRANEMAVNFKSKAVQAIDEINKTEQQKNAESVAKHQQALADKTQALQDFVAVERNFVAERQLLEQALNQARQAGDDERIKSTLAKINELETAESQSTKRRTQLEKQKADAVLAYAEGVIKANKGVIDEQLKAELQAQGFAVAITDAGKVSVKSLEDIADSADQMGLSLKDTALNAAKGLGVDVKLALNEINSAFASNIEQVKQVADGYHELKKAGMDASSLIVASLDKLLDGAKSQREIDEVRKLFVQFGQDGKLSANQVQGGLEAIHDKLNKTPALLDETARAFKELGIISKAEADAAAQKQMASFELVRQSGQASSEQLAQALQKVQKSIEASGDTAKQSWLAGQQSALGLNQAIEQTTQTTYKNTQATQSNSQAKTDLAQATDTATTAEQNLAVATQNTGDKIPLVVAQMREKISVLSQYGATAEQITQLQNTMYQALEGRTYGNLKTLQNDLVGVNQKLEQQAQLFKQTHDRATEMASNVEPSIQSISKAQSALAAATRASINGIVKMDEQTLSNLRQAISQAKQQMQELEATSKGVADNLEIQYQQLIGNNDKARAIEQEQKLQELTQKLKEAKERGNQSEVANYQRAIDKQKQIYSEQKRQSQEQKRAEAQQKAQEQKQTQSTQSQSTVQNSQNSQKTSVSQVIEAFDKRTEQALMDKGAQLFAQELMRQAKTQPR